jgi:hypothetical protein
VVEQQQVDEELLPETKLGVEASTKFALHAIAYHLQQSNSRKNILWEIENWTEEFLLEDRSTLSIEDQAALKKMVVALPMTDWRKFARTKNDVLAIQNLAFELLDEIHAAKDTRVRRPRDVRGTPEWKAHRSWMKAYQQNRKTARKD